jgi:pimeloyl-ACP methyl ester carboxylesterase
MTRPGRNPGFVVLLRGVNVGGHRTFIVGEFDVVGPENVRRHASLTPGALLVVIPNAGHHTQWDTPPATLAAVRSFLRDTESRR